MKLKQINYGSYTRICFGPHMSLTVNNLMVEEAMDFVKEVFSKVKINGTVELKNHCPLNQITSSLSLGIEVFQDGSKKVKKGAKFKTIYGLTNKAAYDIFTTEYKLKYPDGKINFNKAKLGDSIHIIFNNKALVFTETTVQELYDTFIKVITNCELKNDPFSKTVIQVRIHLSGKSNFQKGSLSKTIHGISPENARQLFLDNYEKYI